MRHVVLNSETDYEGWRQATRALVLAGVPPDALTWSVGRSRSAYPDSTGTFQVPRGLVDLASLAIQNRNAERFGLLYGLVWRAHAGEHLPDNDAAVTLVRRMALAVRADAHRMRTLMRFLPVPEDGRTRFLGWHEPAHFVLQANARLMVRRYSGLLLSIVSPDAAAHWDGSTLLFGAGLRHVPDDEALLAWWESHRDMLLDQANSEVSVPEAEDVDEAPRPPDRPALGPVVLPVRPDPALLRAATDASLCHRCPLHAPASQTVFGEGPSGATVMFVGEQPGDQEDRIGRPFVGPAGQILDLALEEAGIDRRTIYVTNAVKHFKFTQRGKRRLHQTPEVPEIQACGFWVDIERTHLRPKLIVLLGASAARALLGRQVTISRERGRSIVTASGQTVFVTVHPSYLLRLPNKAAKDREYAAFVRDLRAIRTLIDQPR